MLHNILRILSKVIFGIFLFYLVTGFMIIPLVLTLAIPSQGTKFLKHPVLLHSAAFNPFSLQLTLKGFEIKDNQDQEMIGFDRLSVDLDLFELLKRIYHVKTFELDGLLVNVELLPGNQINLLALVPPGILQPKTPQTASDQPAALPAIIIDNIILHQGQVHFMDKTIKPNFSTALGMMELLVTNVTTDPKAQAKVKFHANLDEKGQMSAEVLIKPLAQPLEMETTFNLNGYALGVLTPYVGKYTGRELKNGKMDLSMDYRISSNKLIASHKILVQQFEFGKSIESKDALHLPFGLAVALLEDPQGKIKIALPVSGDMSDPKFKYSHLIIQVIRNFFLNLVTKPFSFLASTLGVSENSSDELGYVRFAPGRVALTLSQQQRLITLAAGLIGHPKLHLEIDGGYDPQVDWKVIQADVFAKDYQKLREDSSWPEGKVYQLLYQRHFGLRALWALTKKYKKGFGRYDDDKLDQDIKSQLIENAPPDPEALSALAQARAKLIHDFLIINGFNAARLSIGHPQSVQSSMGYVPSPFTLTVFNRD